MAGIALSAQANCTDQSAQKNRLSVQQDKSQKIELRADLTADGFAGYAECCAAFVGAGCDWVRVATKTDLKRIQKCFKNDLKL